MEKQGKLQTLISLIFRDVKSENETKRTAVMLRLFAIVMWAYYMVLLGLFVLHGDTLVFDAAIPCVLLYLCSFYLTYRDKTRASLYLVNAVTLCWVVCIVVMLGWDSGVQHFLFVLMMLIFMTSHMKMSRKSLYAVSLCIMRLGLYFYVCRHKPLFEMGKPMGVIFQFLNTITICCIIIVSMYIYSKDSMEMENKLMGYNDRLQKMASMDPLTGLGNRRNMMDYLEKKADSYGNGSINNLSIAIGDVDFFKKINDRYGHECGDIVLKQLSMLMERGVEGKGRVGRWGGEEFLFVLPDYNGDEAVAFLSELLTQIRRMEVEYGEERVSLTMTFGVTEYDIRLGTDETIKEADRKLYLGKENGRNRVVF